MIRIAKRELKLKSYKRDVTINGTFYNKICPTLKYPSFSVIYVGFSIATKQLISLVLN